jgi:hypothetical protein
MPGQMRRFMSMCLVAVAVLTVACKEAATTPTIDDLRRQSEQSEQAMRAAENAAQHAAEEAAKAQANLEAVKPKLDQWTAKSHRPSPPSPRRTTTPSELPPARSSRLQKRQAEIKERARRSRDVRTSPRREDEQGIAWTIRSRRAAPDAISTPIVEHA